MNQFRRMVIINIITLIVLVGGGIGGYYYYNQSELPFHQSLHCLFLSNFPFDCNSNNRQYRRQLVQLM